MSLKSSYLAIMFPLGQGLIERWYRIHNLVPLRSAGTIFGGFACQKGQQNCKSWVIGQSQSTSMIRLVGHTEPVLRYRQLFPWLVNPLFFADFLCQVWMHTSIIVKKYYDIDTHDSGNH
jgi:hypothetical protein